MALGRYGRGRREQRSTWRAAAPSRPPKQWADVTVESESIVVRLSGWRRVWAVKSAIRIPLGSVTSAVHEPDAYLKVPARLRPRAPVAGSTFRVGSYHSLDGWSFWCCGSGRNSVVIGSEGRYRFVVVEVLEPEALASTIRAAAGLATDKPAGRPPPDPSQRRATPAAVEPAVEDVNESTD